MGDDDKQQKPKWCINEFSFVREKLLVLKVTLSLTTSRNLHSLNNQV